MKSIKAILLAAILMLSPMVATNADAGSTGRSYSSGSSRSYSPSRSYAPRSYNTTPKSAPRSYAPQRQAQQPAPVVNRTTVVHQNQDSGGFGGNGLLTGMLVGSALSNNHSQAAPVIVNNPGVPPQQIASQIDYSQGTYAENFSPASPQEEGHGFFYYLFQVILWVGLAGLGWMSWTAFKTWRSK